MSKHLDICLQQIFILKLTLIHEFFQKIHHLTYVFNLINEEDHFRLYLESWQRRSSIHFTAEKMYLPNKTETDLFHTKRTLF